MKKSHVHVGYRVDCTYRGKNKEEKKRKEKKTCKRRLLLLFPPPMKDRCNRVTVKMREK